MVKRIQVAIFVCSCIFLMFVMPFHASKAISAEEPIRVRLASLPLSANWSPIVIAMADLVNRNSRLDITVSNLAGATVAVNSVVQGESEFMLSGSNTTQSFAYHGDVDWNGKPNRHFRVAMVVGETYQSLVTTKSTGIKTYPDVKGKRVPKFKVGVTEWTDGLLEAYGLDLEKDVKFVPTQNFATSFGDLYKGNIDVNFASPAGSMVKTLVEAKGKLHVLPVDQEKIDVARSKRPAFFRGITAKAPPKELFPDTDVSSNTPMTRDLATISTSTKVPDEVVYTFVKTLLEHYKDVQSMNLLVKEFSPQTAVEKAAFPYHDGAVKAFKEAGVWTPELEKWQNSFSK